MFLHSLTAIIREANAHLDARKAAPFNFNEVFLAASEGRLVDLIDAASLGLGYGFTAPVMADKRRGGFEVEMALDAAAKHLEGQELQKAAVGDNPWCLVIAIALSAIEPRFDS